MKKICLLVLICLLFSSAAIAEETVPERYMSILESCNATSVEEFIENLYVYLREASPDEPDWRFTPKYLPFTFRFGGTTKELIKDKKKWWGAVVSSKEVDLEKLADEGIIDCGPYTPTYYSTSHQQLVSKKLQKLLPTDTSKLYGVFFYDYDTETDDATLLLWNYKQSGAPDLFLNEIMSRRSPDQIRRMEGLCRVKGWTEEQLLARPEDWDIALLRISDTERFQRLDQAGLLYDFSQESFLASRTGFSYPGYTDTPSGLFSEDGRMIIIPYECMSKGNPGEMDVLIANAQSPYIKAAIDYAVYALKCADWRWGPDGSMSFEEVKQWKP